MTSNINLPPMTIIVAATLENGIGKGGGLPWRLPKEMKYFARVTTGEPPSSSSTPMNTVIMGRKTWDGIPPKYRPLPGRRNRIITRDVESVDLSGVKDTTAHTSVLSAIQSLLPPSSAPSDSRIFLIGGSQLYSQLLDSTTAESTSTSTPIPSVNRILLTRILTPFECDTFLPSLSQLSESNEDKKRWSKCSHQELCDWLGWDVEEGVVQEKGTEYRFEMWERL